MRMSTSEPSSSQASASGESPAPKSRVVVVQYQRRGLPWYLISPLVVIPLLTAIFLYYRSVTEQYRLKVATAESALESMKERLGAVGSDPRPAGIVPAALPVNQAAPPAVAPPTNPLRQVSAPLAENAIRRVPESEIPRVSDPPGNAVETKPANTPRPATSGSATVMNPANDDPFAALDPRPSEKREARPTPAIDPAAASGEPLPEPSAAKPNPARVAQQTPKDAPPASDPPPAARAHEPGIAQAGPLPLATLPSREEAEREIHAESLRKAQELAENNREKARIALQQKSTEQVEFRESLRLLIDDKRPGIGDDINTLVRKYHRTVDSQVTARAYRVWDSRLDRATKIDRLRALGYSETFILNLISDDLHKLVRMRNGPRDEGDVRVRAAKILLSYGYPHADQRTAPRTPATNATRAPAAAKPARPAGRSS